MTTTIKHLSALSLLSLALVACGGVDTSPLGDDDHAHDAALVYTDYSESAELFVEFPPLVVGQRSRFTAHVTRLADYRPLESGSMEVLLLAGSQTAARFRVNDITRSGIFTPVVTPRDADTFDLVVVVEDGAFRSRHDLGPVTVFDNAESVVVDQPELEGDIGYLKEQQWTAPFATTITAWRLLRPSVPGFATVQVPADAGAEIRAPADGYFIGAGLIGAGDTVSQGAVLGYLVPRLGEGADFGTLLVDVERARAALTLARSDAARLQNLFDNGAVAERPLMEALRALDVAEAEFAAASARVEQYQQGGQAAGISVRTPVAGEVIEASVRPGSFVHEGDRVFRVAAPERRWLETRIPERYDVDLNGISGVWFENAAGATVVLDDVVGARVVQTNAAIEPTTRTAGVILEYPSGLGPLLVGARFPVRVFTAPPTPRLTIPRSAVIDDGGRDVVYVQTGGESFVRRPVDLGIQDGDWVEVIAGLEENDRVVSAGAYYIKLASVGGEEVGHGHAH